MHPQQKFAALSVALFAAFPLCAAETALDAVVVTATRQAVRVNELLSDVTVIDREEIERAGPSTIEELLGRQPGVEFTANGGPGTNSKIGRAHV